MSTGSVLCAVSSSDMMQMIMHEMYHSTGKRRSILICFLSVSFFKMSTIWFIGIISSISSIQICFSPAEKYWNSVHLPGITERWANIYRSNLRPNRVNLIRQSVLVASWLSNPIRVLQWDI